MSKPSFVKLIVYAPKTHMDAMLDLMHGQGCGTSGDGKYEGCAFLTFGHGTWIALKGSKPFKGRLNKREMVQEVKIETTCLASKSGHMVKLLRSIHPYEEPVIELYPLESLEVKDLSKGPVEVLKYK
ncbi:MAG: NGG1p interacting factor NIF3 [archaeon]